MTTETTPISRFVELDSKDPIVRFWANKAVQVLASARNWAAYGADVVGAPGAPEWQRHLLTDPQTSGGLLVSCSPDALARVLDCFHQAGFAAAAAIGGMQARAPGQGSQLLCL